MGAEPIAKRDRIFSIDIVRGIALFGILIVNMPSFLIYTEEMPMPEETGINALLRLLYDVMIQTKFYSIFSFLFGLGFFIFMSRAEQRRDKVYWRFTRRLLALLLIGIVHMVIWFGDILTVYAVIGFLLIPFYRRKTSTILAWAGGTGLLYTAAKAIVLWQTLSGVEINTWASAIGSDILAIFTMFLLGLYAGKRGLISAVATHVKLLKSVCLTALVLSIPVECAMIWTYVHPGETMDAAREIMVNLGTLPTALFFIAGLFVLLTKERIQRVLRPFGYAGQMALSNYLGQTFLVMTIIHFFHIQPMPLVKWLYLAIGIYVFQLVASTIWMRYFERGPMETVWRFMTYGRRRTKPATPAN